MRQEKDYSPAQSPEAHPLLKISDERRPYNNRYITLTDMYIDISINMPKYNSYQSLIFMVYTKCIYLYLSVNKINKYIYRMHAGRRHECVYL